MAMTEPDRKEFKEIVAEGNKSLREWLEATLHPIQKDVDKHSIHIEKVPIIEQKIDNHLQSHISTENDKKFNIEIWVGIAVFIGSQILMFYKA